LDSFGFGCGGDLAVGLFAFRIKGGVMEVGHGRFFEEVG
jgi:hypothetical protein